jgi:hypothetical protein
LPSSTKPSLLVTTLRLARPRYLFGLILLFFFFGSKQEERISNLSLFLQVKSVLADFLVSAGIKPTAIVSYNHLGNNDGKNLSAPSQFRSKEVPENTYTKKKHGIYLVDNFLVFCCFFPPLQISKTNVVDDMVASNPLLYKPGEYPDHVIVIKFVTGERTRLLAATSIVS